MLWKELPGDIGARACPYGSIQDAAYSTKLFYISLFSSQQTDGEEANAVMTTDIELPSGFII